MDTGWHTVGAPRPGWQTLLAGVVALGASGWGGVAFAGAGDTDVQNWPSAARGAVSITLDGGYANHWRYMAPMLAERGFHGTFYIVTDWIEQDQLWASWRTVAQAGHEIGSNSATHVALVGLEQAALAKELEDSRKAIQREIGPSQGSTLAYPFSRSDATVEAALEVAGYLAGRSGGNAVNPATPNLMRLQAWHPLADTSADTMKGWVDTALSTSGWLVVGVHGVYDPDHRYPPNQEGWEAVPVGRYRALVDYLRDKKASLWVAPLGLVSRHIRAREQLFIRLMVQRQDALELRVDGIAGPLPFHFRTQVPPDWLEVEIEVGGTIQTAPVIAGTSPSVSYEVTPPVRVRLRPVARVSKDAGPTLDMPLAAVDAGADGPMMNDLMMDRSPTMDARVRPPQKKSGGCNAAGSSPGGLVVLALMLAVVLARRLLEPTD